MDCILGNFTSKTEGDWNTLKDRTKNELLMGIYESFMMTKDEEDAIDSIQHIFKKM